MGFRVAQGSVSVFGSSLSKFAAKRSVLERREHMYGQNVEHFLWLKVLEPRPAELFVETFPIVFPIRKDPLLDRLLSRDSFVYLERMQVVEPLDEQQIRDLFQ